MMSQANRHKKRDSTRHLISKIKGVFKDRPRAEANEPDRVVRPPEESGPSSAVAASPVSAPTQRSNQQEDLWQKAVQKIQTEERELISSYTVTPASATDAIANLCTVAQEKQAECEKNAWKFELKGRVVILRDVVSKIVACVESFKEIGDVAASIDPVHTAPPWAAVRLLLEVRDLSSVFVRANLDLLQTATAENRQTGILIIGVEKMIYLVNRCKIYEVLYLTNLKLVQDDRGAQTIENLKSALVELYAVMLSFMAFAIQLYHKRSIAKAMDAVLKPTKATEFMKELETREKRVDAEAENCELLHGHAVQQSLGERASKLNGLLSEIKKPILRTDSRVADLWMTLNEDEHSTILQWTSQVSYEENHYVACEKRTPQTGLWILRHGLYSEWRNSSASTILWLHGIRKCCLYLLAGTTKTDYTSWGGKDDADFHNY